MIEDYFKVLLETPYDLFVAPRPYSFDLNEDMIRLIREEFSADIIASKFTQAISGKATNEVEQIGKDIFEDYGESWMKRTMQLGEEYSDRTIEIVKESVDSNGNQFLVFPHVPQRFLEIAYLSTQEYPKFLVLPIVISYKDELAYKLPECFIFKSINERCGAEVANLMTCQNACLKALETLRKVCLEQDLGLDVNITMEASMAKDGYCQFSIKKL